MFLGFLPAWVGDLSSVLGLPAIALAVLVWWLGRKGANRKLEVEEGTLKKSEFDSLTAAQDKAIERAQAEAKEAKEEADEVRDRLDIMDELYDQMRETIIWLRGFVRKLVRTTGYVMDAKELVEFEQTRPPKRPPRSK